ncbi:retropepsin-like aspartic protease [Flavobacterium sp.]|uniref:retropepsin-like aspartic protease n=1 Tax=Flavobacterium sp. TaxID=239 RepID=UPI0026102862|nr:retropepsin-like aspartic protease [Flavobacterium sp.]
MNQIPDILHQQGYKSIPFRVTKTQHLVLYAKINGVRGRFILDTGASNSCLGFEAVEKFHLQTQHSATKAAGAGATGLHTEQSVSNILQLGRWKNRYFPLIVLDLTHVNMALQHYNVKPVDGIIGGDVLLEGHALIDYKARKLYLL